MKRVLYLVVLMALSSSAHAGNSFSFVVAGHRVIIEAPRDCSSPSCASVSIPGIYESRGGRDGDDDTDDGSNAPDAVAPATPLQRRNNGSRHPRSHRLQASPRPNPSPPRRRVRR